MFADVNLIIAGYVFFLIAPPIAWLIARTQSADRRHIAVSVLVSIRANNVFMGLPAVSIAMGAPGVEVVSVFFALSFVGYQILSISYGQLVLSGGLSLRSVVRTLERLLKSPFILACLIGSSFPAENSFISALAGRTVPDLSDMERASRSSRRASLMFRSC
jgi:predicted permease